MIRVVTAWCIGAVLFAACASVTLPSALEVDQYAAAQLACVEAYDARPAVDSCRKQARTSFCSQWPAACDGGTGE